MFSIFKLFNTALQRLRSGLDVAPDATTNAAEKTLWDACPELAAGLDYMGYATAEFDHWTSVIVSRPHGETFDAEKLKKACRAVDAVSRAAQRATLALYELDEGTSEAGIPAALRKQ